MCAVKAGLAPPSWGKGQKSNEMRWGHCEMAQSCLPTLISEVGDQRKRYSKALSFPSINNTMLLC